VVVSQTAHGESGPITDRDGNAIGTGRTGRCIGNPWIEWGYPVTSHTPSNSTVEMAKSTHLCEVLVDSAVCANEGGLCDG
jgi:hypothetical protein